MNLLTIKNMTKAHTDKVLFANADFSINEGEKIGVIGINGTGKSTLLRILAGEEEMDAGSFAKGNHVVIRYLPQNPEYVPGTTVYDYVVTANATEENRWSIEGEAKTILNKLGFAQYDMPVDTLSGGQRKKAALAAALLTRCDILLLDEPTNHLDHEMTEWLESYLRQYRGALVMVTHDRYFLDLVCNRIVEIDRTALYNYDTDYEGYLALKAEREQMAEATWQKHQNILRKEIAWMQRGARARSTKQKAHIARYEALASEEKLAENRQIVLNGLSSHLGKKTMHLEKISKSYGDRTLFSDFTYTFLRTDRVGIVGPNGCGKSTVLKIMMELLLPDSGYVEKGETLKIGYFSQENEMLDGNQRVIDYIRDTAEYLETADGIVSASQMAEQFLFDGTLQYSKIEKLSGGEKRRLYLLKVLLEAPNMLILDEPTNDLDITTLQILEDYLDRFAGILVVVSHDRYFLDRVADRLFAFENGQLRQFEGTYTEYYNLRKAETEKQLTKENGGKPKEKAVRRTREAKIKFTYQEERDYAAIEAEIAALEEKIEQLDSEMERFGTDFIKLRELTEQRKAADRELEEKMERYIYLEEKKEQIEREK